MWICNYTRRRFWDRLAIQFDCFDLVDSLPFSLLHPSFCLDTISHGWNISRIFVHLIDCIPFVRFVWYPSDAKGRFALALAPGQEPARADSSLLERRLGEEWECLSFRLPSLARMKVTPLMNEPFRRCQTGPSIPEERHKACRTIGLLCPELLQTPIRKVASAAF